MSEVAPLISDLAIILIIAGIVTVIFKWLKQPVILGYIVAGIMAGPSVSLVPTVSDPANIKIWADIGVIFLLFAMGLDFSFKKLINVGITAIVATVTIECCPCRPRPSYSRLSMIWDFSNRNSLALSWGFLLSKIWWL